MTAYTIPGVVVSLGLIGWILLDGFESIILPRRVNRRFRPARIFYLSTWRPWAAIGRRMKGRTRETFLSVFGPLSSIVLLACWAIGLILAFALLNRSLQVALNSPNPHPGFRSYLYVSGLTFFTLGFGDVLPTAGIGRFLAVTEGGLGFAFLGLVIGFVPVLHQNFSAREVVISLMDARAGSPPSASQLLFRIAQAGSLPQLNTFLEEWERWAAEVLASHISFPPLSYYRSQHDNQSWLAALTAILDTSAIVIAGVKGLSPYQAQLTFAMARHATVDLALIFKQPPKAPEPDRLSPERYQSMIELLEGAGLTFPVRKEAEKRLSELRATYEPFLNSMAGFFLMNMPPFLPDASSVDNWQTSAWMRRVARLNNLDPSLYEDDHFD